MKPNETTFFLDKEFKSVVIKKVFNAPIENVWNAFTKPEQLDLWWAPKPWKTITKSHLLLPNEQWIYSMNGPDGEKHWGTVQFQKIEKPLHLTWTDWFSDENGNHTTEMSDSLWEIKFDDKVYDLDYKEDEIRTDLTIAITHKRYEDLEKLLEMGFQEGITQTLDQLAELLNGGDKDPKYTF